jgi:Rps23 Pro-64 3,4-dihydroxylase Tpa1-like proline 4-hydroxylase
MLNTRAEDILSLLPSPDHLSALAQEHRQAYATNTPFPHICFDDFLAADVAEDLLAAFPSPDSTHWSRTNIPQERKLSSEDEGFIPAPIRQFLYACNTSRFVTFLEQLTGVPGLIPDPYFAGGGMHQIVRGGKLGVHIDFNKHGRLKITRCLNVIVYLNKEWHDDYGGHLELWDAERAGCVNKYAPLFNRCVVFNTTGKSYHGHPHPLACPDGMSRKSIALYYYVATAERELNRGTEFLTTEPRAASEVARQIMRDITPPVVYRMGRKALFRLGLLRQ